MTKLNVFAPLGRRTIYDQKQILYRTAKLIWGESSQKIIAIEEASELIKELTKNLRGKDNLEAIAEEIADVEITTEQIKDMFDITGKVQAIKKEKLIRLAERVENAAKNPSEY